MPEPTAAKEPLIRNISDTARWTAFLRSLESDRKDALFHDTLALRLAGQRGEEIYRVMARPGGDWPLAMRTYLTDRAVLSSIEKGVDTVVNLAAGLDTRPYRMSLPPALQWIEVDLPAMLEEKEQLLRGEKPVCKLERAPLDLADVPARRKLFARIGDAARSTLVVSEGLICYLEPAEVTSLAKDLAAPPTFRRWVLDLMSPGLLKMLMKAWAGHLEVAGSPLKFAPAEGLDFFLPAGWKAIEVHSLLKMAARAKRLSFFLRIAALFPDSSGKQGGRPWGAVCMFERSA
jgi:methyltransferase (TIGR00027 family)